MESQERFKTLSCVPGKPVKDKHKERRSTMEIVNSMFKGINSSLSPPTNEKQTEHEEAFWSMLMAQMMPLTQPSPDMQHLLVQDQSLAVLIVPKEGQILNTEALSEPIPMPLTVQPLNPLVEHQAVVAMIKPSENHTKYSHLEVSQQNHGQIFSHESLFLEQQTRPTRSEMIIQSGMLEPTSSNPKEVVNVPGFVHQRIQEKNETNIPMHIHVQADANSTQEFKDLISKVRVEKAMIPLESSSNSNLTSTMEKVIVATGSQDQSQVLSEFNKHVLVAKTQDQSQVLSEFNKHVLVAKTQDQSQVLSEFDKKAAPLEIHDHSQIVDARSMTLEPIAVQSKSEVKPLEFPQLNELELNQTIKQMIQTEQKEMIIKLKPEGIGEIMIKLSHDNKVEIKFYAINAEVLNSIEKQLPHLQVSLKEYNVMIETSLNFNHQQKEHQREHSLKHHHLRLNHDVESKGDQPTTFTNMNRFNRYA